MMYNIVPNKMMKAVWRYKLSRLAVFTCLVLLCLGVCYFSAIVIGYLQIAAKIRSAHDRSVIVHIPRQSDNSSSSSSSLLKPKVKHDDRVASNKPVENRCNDCSIGFCSADPDLMLFSAASTDIQAFFNLTFRCVGEIVAWKILDMNPSAGKIIYLDVLKYDESKDEGTWMGFNKIVTTGADDWVTYEIPEKERVRVEPGLFIGMHYDDVAADPIIPFADETTNPAKFPLSDGFTILLDHQELSRVAKIGVIAEVAMSKLFNSLLVSIKRNWRSPALAAVILPLKQ